MLREVARREGEDEVPVVRTPALVDDDHAVPVAVEREARVGLAIHDESLQRLGSRGAAARVDVLAVGHVEEGEHLGAGVGEYRWGDAIGRSVRAVERDPQAFQPRRHRDEEVLVVLDQAAHVADEPDAALGRARERAVPLHQGFDLVFDGVGELLRAVVEELDTVIGSGIVRRADHRSGDEVVLLRQIREARRGDMADQTDLHAHRAQPRGQRALEHPAAAAGVAAHDHRVTGTAEDMARRSAQAEGELRGQVEIRDPAYPVGAEQPRRLHPPPPAERTRSISFVW